MNTTPVRSVDGYGVINWHITVDGARVLHRIDGPACEYPNGTKEWYQNNVRHRIDGPAYIHPDRIEEWFVDGKRHRTDGPASVTQHCQQWCVNGELHRLDGPAVEWTDGTKCWYVDGKRHRADGPAIVTPDGSSEWWVNNKRHNVDGPAVVYYKNGRKTAAFYYLHNQKMPKAKWEMYRNNSKVMTLKEIEAILGHSIILVENHE